MKIPDKTAISMVLDYQMQRKLTLAKTKTSSEKAALLVSKR